MNKLKQKYFIWGLLMRKISIEERAISLGRYIIETKDTVRSTAKKFGVSKSTVHKDVTDRLSKKFLNCCNYSYLCRHQDYKKHKFK